MASRNSTSFSPRLRSLWSKLQYARMFSSVSFTSFTSSFGSAIDITCTVRRATGAGQARGCRAAILLPGRQGPRAICCVVLRAYFLCVAAVAVWLIIVAAIAIEGSTGA
eukprot:scaffold937_cov502-Prasinococcus_capsulatus_cf.AAC.7